MLFKLFSIFAIAAVVNATSDREPARLCVTRQIELDKCNDIRRSLINYHLLDRLECLLETVDECIRKIKENEADVIIMDSKLQHLAFDKGLRTMLWENYRSDDVIVALGNENLTLMDIKRNPLILNVRDLRLVHSALLFNKIRFGKNTCEVDRDEKNVNSISFLRAKSLNLIDLSGKKLICKDLTLRDISDYNTNLCNFETGAVNAIITRNGDFQRRGQLISIFNEIIGYFGPHGHLRDILKLFGTYKGEQDVLFNDDTQEFNAVRTEVNGVTEQIMNEMLCDGNIIEN